MYTLTTKQLRQQMPAVVKMLQSGQPVRLSYRRKIIGNLEPLKTTPQGHRPGTATAVLSALDQLNLGPLPDSLKRPAQSFKQEVASLRQRDLKQP